MIFYSHVPSAKSTESQGTQETPLRIPTIISETAQKPLKLPPLAQSTPKPKILPTSVATSERQQSANTSASLKVPDQAPPAKEGQQDKGEGSLSQEALSKAFFAEINAFSEELATFTDESESFLQTEIGTDDERDFLRKKTKQMCETVKEICKDTKVSIVSFNMTKNQKREREHVLFSIQLACAI